MEITNIIERENGLNGYQAWQKVKCEKEVGHSYSLRIAWGKAWYECDGCGKRMVLNKERIDMK